MKGSAKSAETQPILVIDSEVVRLIRQHARSSGETEVCGVLIGQDRDNRIQVAACIEGQNAEEAGAHVTFTQDTWEHIYAVKDKRYPAERIVGWYHSHPGFGVFLSEHDTFIHRNFFSSPGQVAWVFDPHSDEEGCFGWVNGQIERLKRIGVLDRRGGERAEANSQPEPEPAAITPRNGDAESKGRSKEKDIERKGERGTNALRVRHRDVDDSDSQDSSSLERLVTNVFLCLLTLALGFALSWYLFPRVMVVPVPVDPQTGRPLDPRMEQILSEPREGDSGNSQRADPGKPGQPSAPNGSGTKGDDGKRK